MCFLLAKTLVPFVCRTSRLCSGPVAGHPTPNAGCCHGSGCGLHCCAGTPLQYSRSRYDRVQSTYWPLQVQIQSCMNGQWLAVFLARGISCKTIKILSAPNQTNPSSDCFQCYVPGYWKRSELGLVWVWGPRLVKLLLIGYYPPTHPPRSGGSCHLVRPLSDQPPVGSGHFLHRDGEADGECGESHAVHPRSTLRERGRSNGGTMF